MKLREWAMLHGHDQFLAGRHGVEDAAQDIQQPAVAHAGRPDKAAT